MKPQQQGAAPSIEWTQVGSSRWEGVLGPARVVVRVDDGYDSGFPYKVIVTAGRRVGTSESVMSLKAAKDAAARLVR